MKSQANFLVVLSMSPSKFIALFLAISTEPRRAAKLKTYSIFLVKYYKYSGVQVSQYTASLGVTCIEAQHYIFCISRMNKV